MSRLAVVIAFCASLAAAQLIPGAKPVNPATEPCSVTEATPCAVPAAPVAVKPKVRAITAFVRITPQNYAAQVQDALKFLRAAKSALEKQGYEVETIRITTQPFPEYVRGMSNHAALAFFKKLDDMAVKEGFDCSLGPAIFPGHSGLGSGSTAMADLLARVIAQSKILEGSVEVAGAQGIDWEAVGAAAHVIKYLEDNTARSQGNFNFTAAALVPEYTPFYPASWHDGPGRHFALALESANVVRDAFTRAHMVANPAPLLTQALTPDAKRIEQAAQAVARQTGWTYEGIDLSPAPLKEISIGGAMEELLHPHLGAAGTMTVAAAITRGLKAVPVKQAGYSGLMLPILEDSVLAQRWSEGALNTDALLAYSAVCGTGLDTIPLPGDITEDRIAAMIGDVASLSVKWHKPLAARLLPVKGKKAGERTDFDDPFLVNTTLQKVP